MLKMKRIIGVLLAAGLALAIPALADGKEEKVKLSDCPEAVQKTIKDNANGGTIVEIEKETNKDGTVTYEAEVKKTDGTVIEIEVAADGKLIELSMQRLRQQRRHARLRLDNAFAHGPPRAEFVERPHDPIAPRQFAHPVLPLVLQLRSHPCDRIGMFF